MMSLDHFYVYLPSNGDTQNIFPQNKPNNFSIPMDDTLHLNSSEWEVGLSEINIPNDFYNVHQSMTKVVVGNEHCEYRFQIPAGEYTPEAFCEMMNLILEKIKMFYRVEFVNLQNDPIPYPDTNEYHMGIDLDHFEDLSDLERLKSIRVDPEEVQTDVDAYVRQTYQFFEGINYTPPQRDRRYAKQGVQALLMRPADVESERHNMGLIKQGITLLKDDNPKPYNAFRAYRKSLIRFHYNKAQKRIEIRLMDGGVRHEYIEFQSPKLAALLGLTPEDEEQMKQNRPSTAQPRTKSIKGSHRCNFNRFNSHAYIYTNIIAHSRIGSIYAPILKYINIPDNHDGSVLNYTYEKPQYYSLVNSAINSIAISLHDEWGDPLLFHDLQDIVVAVLHFRKKRTNGAENSAPPKH
jgi:hypothetical protein